MSAAAATSSSIAELHEASAQHSAGPVTAEGKERSSSNALRHGLSGRTVVLPYESREEYEALKLEFIREHRPATGLELQLLTRMTDCWWRLRRAMRMEAEYLEQRGSAVTEAEPAVTGDSALILLFCDPVESRSLRLFMRYLASAQNSWRTACAEYQQTHKARVRREQEADMAAAMREARLSNYEVDEDEDPDDEGDEQKPGEQPAAAEPRSEDLHDVATSDAAKPDETSSLKSSHLPKSGLVSYPDFAPESPRPVPGLPCPRRAPEETR